MGPVYRFIGLVHYHVGKPGGMQAGKVLDRVLDLAQQVTGRESHWSWIEHLKQ